MSEVTLTLLGAPQVTWQHGRPPHWRSKRTQAILGYLVAEKRPLAREELVALFWPDEETTTGKANLRRQLHNLRNIVPGCWQIDRKVVHFVPDAETAVDLYQLLHLEKAEKWLEAADLLRGDFLEGIYLEECSEFELWLLGERERWRQRAERILRRGVDTQISAGNDESALRLARHLLKLIPWHETIHRQLMMLLARDGQFAAALKQYETCRQLLWDELGVEPSVETQTLYEQIRNPSPLSKNNIPTPTTPLIGRTVELAQLNHWLQNGVRLITITGVGGMGKTRLALALAQSLTDRIDRPFSDGIYFVDLTTIDVRNQLPPTIAGALNLSLEPSDQRTPTQQLLDYLRSKQLLLILDNYEQILPSIGLVTDILHTATNIRLVITSREQLRLQGEQALSLKGLPYTAPVSDISPNNAEVEQTDAEHLFVTVARRVQPELKFEPNDSAELQQICRAVEGMPLALELAATWADTMSLAAIASKIKGNLDFLETDIRDLPLRHQSIRAVFDSTWERLSHREQEVLAQSSVFRGGFSLEAAQKVTGASVHTLSRLVRRSLIKYSRQDDRYHIHELLRQYAADMLDKQSNGRVIAEEKHSTYFCQWLHKHSSDIRITRQPFHETVFALEMPNIERAWRQALNRKQVENLMAAVNAMGWILMRLHHFRNGRKLFSEVVDVAEQQVTMRPKDSQWRYLLAAALLWKADFAELFGEKKLCRQWCLRSLELLHASDVAPLSFGHELSRTYVTLGDTSSGEEAVSSYRLALDAARSSGDKWGEAHALQRLGLGLTWSGGDLAEAEEAAYAGYQKMKALQDLRGTSWGAYSLAWLAERTGKYDAGEQFAREFYNLSRRLGSGRDLARSTYTLGWIALSQGDFAAASQWEELSLDYWREQGHHVQRYNPVFTLGLAYIHQARLEEAQAVAERCRALATEQNHNRGMTYAHMLSGMISLALDHPRQALQAYTSASRLLDASSSRNEWLVIQVHLLIALAYLRVDLAMAKKTLDDAEHYRHNLGDYPQITAMLNAVKAAVLIESGQEEEARKLWQTACREPLIAKSRWYAIVGSHGSRLNILTAQ